MLQLLELLLTTLFIAVMGLEFFWPLFRGVPVFPSFRRRKAEAKIAGLREQLEQQDLVDAARGLGQEIHNRQQRRTDAASDRS